MGRSKKKSVAIPHPILDGLREQQSRGTLEYPSENAILVGLARYQLMVGRPHSITAEIARMGPEDQDVIDDFLLELNVRGHSIVGSFLRHVSERTLDGNPEPDPETIERTSARTILEWAKRWQQGDEGVWEEI